MYHVDATERFLAKQLRGCEAEINKAMDTTLTLLTLTLGNLAKFSHLRQWARDVSSIGDGGLRAVLRLPSLVHAVQICVV